MKTILRLFKSYCPVFLILAALIFSCCSEETNEERHSYRRYYDSNKEKARQLLIEYHARMFDHTNYKEILSAPALLDSTIISFSRKDNSFFVKAEIRNYSGKKIYAALKCPQKFYEDYKKSKSNHAYLIASINKIDNINVSAEADTLDKKTKNISLDNTLMLSGNCLAYVEIPEYSPIY